MNKIRMLMTLLCATLMVFATVPAVHAITYDITSDHATGGLGNPPFGTVTLVQDGEDVDVTVHLYSPYYFVKTGSADLMDFKFNAVDVGLEDIDITQNAPYTLAAAQGNFSGDGTGFFAFGITGTDQPDGAVGRFNTDIVFEVENALIADLTHPNADGNIFVVDLFSSNLDGNTGNGNTGPADVTGTGVPLPEPLTLLLLGLGLVGVAGVSRFRK